jgi:hypothetical protein
MFLFGSKPHALDSDELDAFFEALGHADETELLRMRAAWQAVGTRAHEEAWEAVRAVAARDDLSKEVGRVRDRAMAWASKGNDLAAYQIANSSMWAQIKLEAEEAIVDVALGIALGDRLDQRSRETLLAAAGGGEAAAD